MYKKLTIAIPTFNRYTDLRITLNFFLSEIAELKKEDATLINLHVQDNNSEDNTMHYLEGSNIVDQFRKYNSSISFESNSRNLGFDQNVKLCFLNSKSEYIWLVSDDDQVFKNSLKYILDICKNNIDLAHMLFEQYPFLELSKFSRKETYLEEKLSKKSLYSFIYLPKLTSFIYKLEEVNKVFEKLDSKSGFIHIEIALRISLKKDSICFFDNRYIGKPRALNSSNDFSPIVFNNLYFLTKKILNENNRIDLIDSYENEFEFSEVNPLLMTLKFLILKNFRLRPIKSTVIKDSFYRLKTSEFKYKFLDNVKIFAYFIIFCASFLVNLLFKIRKIILDFLVKYLFDKLNFIKLFLIKINKKSFFEKSFYFKSVINPKNILLIDHDFSVNSAMVFKDKKFADCKILNFTKNGIIELSKKDHLFSNNEIPNFKESILKDDLIRIILDELKISKIDLLFLNFRSNHKQFIKSISELLFHTKFIVIDLHLKCDEDFQDLLFIGHLLKRNNHRVYIKSKIGLISLFDINLNSINSKIQLISILNI